MTLLEIVQEVQRRLRLPVAALITEAHAQILVSFVNEVQRDYMVESAAWGELMKGGSFPTVASNDKVTVTLDAGDEIAGFASLQIADNPPIIHESDERMRGLVRSYSGTPSRPLHYRIWSRSGASMTFQFAPTPDQAYTVTAEAFKKPPRLSAAGDVPALDDDLIVLGVTALAKKEQGDDFTPDLAMFREALASRAVSQGTVNWLDVEPV